MAETIEALGNLLPDGVTGREAYLGLLGLAALVIIGHYWSKGRKPKKGLPP